jgi:TusA-related sulfurtransferase
MYPRLEKYIHRPNTPFCVGVLTDQNTEAPKPDRTLDVLGFFCPEPIFRIRIMMDQMNRGEILEVLADDPAAKSDITSWANKTGQEVLSIDKDGDSLRFLIKKAK